MNKNHNKINNDKHRTLTQSFCVHLLTVWFRWLFGNFSFPCSNYETKPWSKNNTCSPKKIKKTDLQVSTGGVKIYHNKMFYIIDIYCMYAYIVKTEINRTMYTIWHIKYSKRDFKIHWKYKHRTWAVSLPYYTLAPFWIKSTLSVWDGRYQLIRLFDILYHDD